MKLGNALLGAALVMAVSLPAMTAETDIPSESMGAIATFATYEKFRIYSEVCSEMAPESQPEFDAAMVTFGERMKSIGADILETAEFSAMRTQVVPQSLVDAIEKDFANTRAMHRARAPDSEACRGAHEHFTSQPDSHWMSAIASALNELRETGKPFAPAPRD